MQIDKAPFGTNTNSIMSWPARDPIAKSWHHLGATSRNRRKVTPTACSSNFPWGPEPSLQKEVDLRPWMEETKPSRCPFTCHQVLMGQLPASITLLMWLWWAAQDKEGRPWNLKVPGGGFHQALGCTEPKERQTHGARKMAPHLRALVALPVVTPLILSTHVVAYSDP